jgi:quercetin dioxygenase-like cupin family protein
LKIPSVLLAVESLKKEIVESAEPFIWKVLPDQLLRKNSAGVRSGWIFVLKPNINSPAHTHPNSVQYTTFIEGSGKIQIREERHTICNFSKQGNQQAWYVIPKNVSHSVNTRDDPVVVFSFHTCPAEELIEVETSSGRSRFYERQGKPRSLKSGSSRL